MILWAASYRDEMGYCCAILCVSEKFYECVSQGASSGIRLRIDFYRSTANDTRISVELAWRTLDAAYGSIDSCLDQPSQTQRP